MIDADAVRGKFKAGDDDAYGCSSDGAGDGNRGSGDRVRRDMVCNGGKAAVGTVKYSDND